MIGTTITRADLLLRGFGSVARMAGAAVITVANPVHAVLFLVLVFCQAAGRRLVREAELMALLLLVVYVGAIAVLFLFVVRRLNVQAAPRRRGEWRASLPRATFVGALLFGELRLVHVTGVAPGARAGALASEVVPDGRVRGPVVWVEALDPRTNLRARGQVLYTHAFLYFLRASLVLLVARVGAIVLTLPSGMSAGAGQAGEGGTVPARRQQLHEQLARDRDRAVVLLRRGGGGPGSAKVDVGIGGFPGVAKKGANGVIGVMA